MSKNPCDQIDKAAWSLMESIKDTVVQNVMAASNSGQLELKGEALQRLIIVLNASVEEGYHRSARVFSKSVGQALASAALPPLEASAKKNSG